MHHHQFTVLREMMRPRKEVALFLLNDFSAFTEPSFDTTAAEGRVP
jgi:hypothetical protein